MRNRHFAMPLAAMLGVALLGGTLAPARAQQSVESTIEALKPRPEATRGSRPVVSQPGTTQGTAVPAGAPSIDIAIRFTTGSAELTPEAIKALDILGKALSSPQLNGQHFRIEGHTDTVGTHDANQVLSASRANAVMDFLARTYGIDRARLEAVGVGENALVVQTGDQVDEPRNRIVRVINTTG